MRDSSAATYEECYGHPPDFLVRYRILSPQEGGRKSPIGQNYRCNWFYGLTPPNSGTSDLYGIYPQFLNKDGSVLLDSFAPTKGIASMWIPNPKIRRLHTDRIKVGVQGFMSEANRPVAECIVTKIVALHDNPISDEP